MTTPAVAAALDAIARGFHDLSLAVAAGDSTSSTATIQRVGQLPATADQPAPTTATDRRCQCGGTVTYQQWTSKAGKDCKAWKCERSRVGEDHFIEWAQ